MVCLPVAADRDDLAPDGRGAEGVEHPVGDLLANVHERERIGDLDGTHVATGDTCFVRDGTHDVTRPQAGPSAATDPQSSPATGSGATRTARTLPTASQKARLSLATTTLSRPPAGAMGAVAGAAATGGRTMVDAGARAATGATGETGAWAIAVACAATTVIR